MDFELYSELERLGLRLDGLANMSGLLSDAVTDGPNEAETYKESITLLYYLMAELQENYNSLLKRIHTNAFPRKEGAGHE